MFSEDQERRSERQKDGGHHGFIRHRIPYRLLGRRSLGAKRLVVSSKVLFPAIPTQNCDVVLTFPAHTDDATLMWLLARLKTRAPALTVHVRHHSHTGIYGFYLTALYDNLLQGAEELGILKPLKSDYGGGMKEFVFEDQDCFAGIEDESTFLTSQERQSIVLHFLHELRATGEDTLAGITFIEGQPIVPLLIINKVVSQVFPLHNHNDLKILRQTWVQAIFSKQPLDEVCRYFGVKIGLYFAYLGHYTTWLILPALVGLIIFLMQGQNQLLEDLCYVGFALFNVIWATLYLKFWKRASTVYCYKWGTLEKKDDLLKDPRPLFKGDLVKSPITGHLELAYPAWKRLLFQYFVTFPVIAICLAFVFIIMLLCFELQEWVNGLIAEEELPYIFSFLPKVLLAVVVTILDEVYKEIAIWLTHKENYRLEQSHETSLIIKLVMFQFVNSFLSLFYIGFYLRDMDRLRDQLAALLITRQVLGNVKEALAPYIIWKARLYSVGYRIATQMSPASVEKEVRRMTARPKAHSSSMHSKKNEAKDSDSDSSTLTEEDEEALPALTQAEVESAMKKYEDTLDDYLEMCIQFGYITLFSSAFPLAALCALFNNVIEIRSDAFKLCLTFQRPFGQRVDSIGIWQDVLLVFSVIAVIVNCSLVGTSGLLERMLPGLSSTTYCIIIVLVEHFILTTKFSLYRSIPDLPPCISTEMARLEYQRTEAIKQLVSQLAQNHGGGSLISHYPGSPSIRRRKMPESPVAESSLKEPSPPSGGSVKTPMSQPSSATSSHANTAASRPTDFFTITPKVSDKPDVPPRTSIQKTESAPLPPQQPLTLESRGAENVVSETLHPMFDYSDIRTSEASQASPTVPTPVPPRIIPQPSKGVSKGNSEVMRRILRKKMDLEDGQRRRSEPVSAAVTQALSLQRQDTDGMRKKKIYENKEDLRAACKVHLSTENLRRSMDGLNSLRGLEANLSSSLPGLNDASGISSASLPGSSQYVASPRPLKSLGDPSFLATKILSRKSRSFSTADVSDVKSAFRERFSWRGELVQSSKSTNSKKKLNTNPESSKKIVLDEIKSDVSDISITEDEPKSSSVAKDVVKLSTDAPPAPTQSSSESATLKPPSGYKMKESGSDSKLNVFKAFRESVSKPLSLSPRASDSKHKKT
ncbi:anoctamin-8 [Biomphalaria glabrata]|nr:anoctamin-8-like [Biomphalaria glabrata]